MLYIIEGSDVQKRNKALETIKSKVSPDQILRYDFLDPEVVSLADTQDLFSEKRMIVVYEASFKDYTEAVSGFIESSHAFVCMIHKVLADDKKLLKDATFFDCTEKPKEKYNLFPLSDALASRNKKDLWVLYQKAIRSGVVGQDMINILIWQAKTMVLASRIDLPASGLKPFVYNKARQSQKFYSVGELEILYRNLIKIQHDAHKGQDMGLSLERLFISL